MAGIVSPRPAPAPRPPAAWKKAGTRVCDMTMRERMKFPAVSGYDPAKKPRHGSAAFSVARKLRKRAAQHTPNGYRHRLSQALRPVTGRQYGAALGPFPIALQSVRLRA